MNGTGCSPAYRPYSASHTARMAASVSQGWWLAAEPSVLWTNRAWSSVLSSWR